MHRTPRTRDGLNRTVALGNPLAASGLRSFATTTLPSLNRPRGRMMRRIPMPFSQLGHIESLSHPQLYRFVWRWSTRTDSVGELRSGISSTFRKLWLHIDKNGRKPNRVSLAASVPIRNIQRSSTRRAVASNVGDEIILVRRFRFKIYEMLRCFPRNRLTGLECQILVLSLRPKARYN